MSQATAHTLTEEGVETPQVKRYECRWRDDPARPGRQVHYWVDNEPTRPHWTESTVMRWDLLQGDWHLIWPELIDHPCARLFAPNHPDRKGPRRFRDWVESWPAGFAWQAELPAHLHPAIEKALSALAGGEEPEQSPGAAEPGSDEPTNPSPLPSLDVAGLIERLAVALLKAEDADRPAIAQALSTLALAPDSGRTLEALKRILKA